MLLSLDAEHAARSRESRSPDRRRSGERRRSPAATRTRPLTIFPTRNRAVVRCDGFVSPASPSLLYLNNLGNGPERLVDGLTVWEQARYVGIKHHHIGAFGIPAHILAAYPSSEVIVSAHFVVSTSFLLHISSVQAGLPSSR